MEALVVKLFAGITSIKASYAELQMAKNPYNSDAIQVADQSVFLEEQARSFSQITMMLAEIQEQQSLMKTYEIMIKKLELEKKLEDYVSSNKSLEKKLNASEPWPRLDNLQISSRNPNHFVQFLQRTLRYARSFMKLMIREMESANWDLDSAINFIEPTLCFNLPNFSLTDEHHQPQIFFKTFKKLKSSSPKELLAQNSNSSFKKFIRAKYLQLVHVKMKCSLFRIFPLGNLN
ncbi:hypothetical protein UlMin_040307 [Ulmus minor]